MRVYTGHHDIQCISYMYHYNCDHTCEMAKHYTLTCMNIYNYESLFKCINKCSVYMFNKLYHLLYLIVHRHVSYMTHLF